MYPVSDCRPLQGVSRRPNSTGIGCCSRVTKTTMNMTEKEWVGGCNVYLEGYSIQIIALEIMTIYLIVMSLSSSLVYGSVGPCTQSQDMATRIRMCCRWPLLLFGCGLLAKKLSRLIQSQQKGIPHPLEVPGLTRANRARKGLPFGSFRLDNKQL